MQHIHTQPFRSSALRKLIKTVQPLSAKNGPWIAGGSARRMWFKENWLEQDIDLYFPNKESFNTAVENLEDLRHGTKKIGILKRIWQYLYPPSRPAIAHVIATRQAVTYLVHINFTIFKVQLIRKSFPESMEKMWDNFDLNVCKFATDGKTLFAHEDALHDCEKKILRKNKAYDGKLNGVRVIKYSLYGFNPTEEVMNEMVERYKDDELHEGIDNDYV